MAAKSKGLSNSHIEGRCKPSVRTGCLPVEPRRASPYRHRKRCSAGHLRSDSTSVVPFAATPPTSDTPHNRQHASRSEVPEIFDFFSEARPRLLYPDLTSL